MLKPQLVEQATAGRLAKVKNIIEAAGAPVVRIGDFCVPGCVGIEASKKMNFLTRLSVGGQCMQRLLVVDTPERAAELSERYGEPHPHLLVAAGSPRLDAFLQLPHAELLLLDPNGNAVMRYRPLQTPDGVQQDFKGIRKDLKKLLRLSNIG